MSHTTEDLIFEWDPDTPLVVDENIELPQFDVVNNFTADCSQVYSTGNFTCLEVVFQLKRRLGYYLFHTYMPTCLIVIMSWISFWIKPEAAPARVTLGVTSLLTLSTQHAKSQASLPPVSYIKIIDMFMSTCTIFVFLALMEYALVNVVLGDGPEGVSPPQKGSKEVKSKSRCFIPRIINDVKKRCKKRTTEFTEALNYPHAVSNIPSEPSNEETIFRSSASNTTSPTSHNRVSPHSNRCASDSQCQHSVNSYPIHSCDIYAMEESQTVPRACHHIESPIDCHRNHGPHRCADPPCYSAHTTEPCCELHTSSHSYCAATLPSFSQVNPHTCQSSYYCLPTSFSERRNSVSHCSSYCPPLGESHRTGSHSDFFGHSYYNENEATETTTPTCMVSKQPLSIPSAHIFNSHTCSGRARGQPCHNFERRSRSVERTIEKHATKARKGSSRSTEWISDEKKWKPHEWNSNDQEKEIEVDEKLLQPTTSISCGPSGNAKEETSTSPNFRKVPTPPPPPNKPTGLTLAQKRRARAIMVDRFSRVFFPSTFGLLNAVYWIIFWIYL